jgi:hypothetical protein
MIRDNESKKSYFGQSGQLITYALKTADFFCLQTWIIRVTYLLINVTKSPIKTYLCVDYFISTIVLLLVDAALFIEVWTRAKQ